MVDFKDGGGKCISCCFIKVFLLFNSIDLFLVLMNLFLWICNFFLIGWCVVDCEGNLVVGLCKYMNGFGVGIVSIVELFII